MEDAESTEATGPGPSPQRQARLFALLYSTDEVEDRSRRIYDEMLERSPHLRAANFTRIGPDDLERLFAAYDRAFFRGRLAEMLLEDGALPMGFRLSGRLVRAAGMTTRLTRPVRRGGRASTEYEYEITVSTTLLFGTFQGVDRRVTVGGLEVRDRLEALQRIFEHELLHLAEFLGWGKSNCRAANFRALSRRIFAHEAVYHDLVTPREQAVVAHGIAVGDRVSFEHEGVRHVGRVNRITRRATVLVESPTGRPFSDGKRYLTFYVPLAMLNKV